MDLTQLLAARGGVVSARDLDLIGITTAARASLVRHGQLLRPRRDVYLGPIAEDPFGYERHRRIAVGIARSTGLIPSHEAAAAIHGLDVLMLPDRMTVVHPHLPHRHSRRDLTVHAAVPPHLICAAPEPWSDVHAVSPAACAIQITCARGGEAGLVAAEAALHHGTRAWELADAAAVLEPKCHRTVERVLRLASHLSESVLESRCKWAFDRLDLPQPDQQVRIYDHDGFVGRVDFQLGRLIIEADGLMKYTTADALKREKIRDVRLRRLGYHVVHVVWHDLDDLAGFGRYLVSQGMRAAA